MIYHKFIFFEYKKRHWSLPSLLIIHFYYYFAKKMRHCGRVSTGLSYSFVFQCPTSSITWACLEEGIVHPIFFYSTMRFHGVAGRASSTMDKFHAAALGWAVFKAASAFRKGRKLPLYTCSTSWPPPCCHSLTMVKIRK